jgi:DNA adenine methylase
MLSYIGGKSKIGKWIVTHYPTDIETYVEPFGGMFWCYFNMNPDNFPNLKKVVYNDINQLNYNLFQCVQDPDKLHAEMSKIPCQSKGMKTTPPLFKQLHSDFQKEIFDNSFVCGDTDYEVAAKYAYVVTQVFSGLQPHKSNFIDLKGNYKSKYLTFMDKLKNDKWVGKINKITDVEMLDYRDCLDKYNDPTCYIYLDPPYWQTEDYYSNNDFDSKDHEILSEKLKETNSKFSLSYYEFEKLHEFYPQDEYNWYNKDFVKPSAAIKGKKQAKATELIITNY